MDAERERLAEGAPWRRWGPYLAERQWRTGDEDELDLLDTGAFDDDRYWDITVDYAKATPEDVCIVLRARNAGPEEATLHVLPTLWFRNRWSWREGVPKPAIEVGQNNVLVA